MGILTQADFRDTIRFHLNSNKALTVTELDRFLNQAYTHVCMPQLYQHRELRFEYLRVGDGASNILDIDDAQLGTDVAKLWNSHAQAVGDDVPLAADMRLLSVESVTVLDATDITHPVPLAGITRYPVRPIDHEHEASQTHTDTGAASVISTYAIVGRQIILDTVLEATQTAWVRLYLEPPKFVATTTDTTRINSYWDDVIVCGAAWKGSRYLSRFQQAEGFKQEFAGLIRDAVDYESLEARGRQVRFDVEDRSNQTRGSR